MRICVRRGILASVIAGALAAAAVVGGPATASAQTPFVPYFGKVYPHYNTFDWYIYNTDHFQIYYYPSEKPDLARIAGYAESAYQQISSDLKHDIAFKIPLVIFKTHTEFEEQNIVPGGAQPGVQAFTEPGHNRMVVPIDDPPDIIYGLITHELTHVFEFDIIPESLVRRPMPLWVDEGLAEYERGAWSPLDLMMVRDLALTDSVPRMSKVENYGNFNNARVVPYDLGHAVFEFIESRWGKEGIRQFLFALRKNVIGGGEDAYQDAFQMKPEEFDRAFERYLKDRFKPFRDLEQPSDYGANLAPQPDKTDFIGVISVAPSPSGDLLAAIAPNAHDQEYDVILISARDGKVIRNLTPGFDKDMGWDHISLDGERFITVPYLSWAPGGDRLAYFVRKGPRRELIIQDIVTRKIEERIPIKGLDQPESPCFSADGRHIIFSALNDQLGDIYEIDLQTKAIRDLTNDRFAEFAPVYSPDGRLIVYLTRVSGAYKLFKLDTTTGKKTQITFGTQDESTATFLDDHTIVFSSTATDPRKPVSPEVARNGNIYNIWTLDLNSGQLQQYTNTSEGNVSPVVLKTDPGVPRVAFTTYYKGNYGLHAIDLKSPVLTVASADFGAPGPIIDFQSPLTHTLVQSNIKKKGTFGKLFLEGRPPINVGVTSGGDVFGGTAVTFGDVLGDHQFNFYAASVAQYRQLAFSYINLSRRFQYAAQAFSQTLFYYGQLGGVFYDPAFLLSRSQAQATQTVNGGSIFGIYPFDQYRRVEVSAGIVHQNETYNDPVLQAYADQYQQQQFGRTLFNSGTLVPLDVSYIQETTVFRDFGPLSGNTMQLRYEVAPPIGGSLSRQTFDVDARYYMRIGASGLLALRARAFKSFGSAPDFLYFGGNSEMRGYDYLQFIGQNAVFGDAELRFPIIEAALTPIGVLGGVRGVFFFNMGGGWFDNTGFQFFSNSTQTVTPTIGYGYDANGNPVAIPGTPTTVSGFRLQDARASYGLGLETFALGFPIHFDWSWRTTFNRAWENVVFASSGGSSAFRKARFTVWIGYDF
ncbi:MAG: PD40 domain-containing protein [Acidobacteriota bacterium]|nr:PD40 domain-containing protein [Acidobacteriota bacterium]